MSATVFNMLCTVQYDHLQNKQNGNCVAVNSELFFSKNKLYLFHKIMFYSKICKYVKHIKFNKITWFIIYMSAGWWHFPIKNKLICYYSNGKWLAHRHLLFPKWLKENFYYWTNEQ